MPVRLIAAAIRDAARRVVIGVTIDVPLKAKTVQRRVTANAAATVAGCGLAGSVAVRALEYPGGRRKGSSWAGSSACPRPTAVTIVKPRSDGSLMLATGMS